MLDDAICRVRQLGYIGIETAHLGQWEEFATSILGLQLGDKDADGTLHLRVDARAHRIICRPGSSDDLAYVGWELQSPAHLDETARKLDVAGIPFTRASADACAQRRVGGMLLLADPSGIATELYWGAQVDQQPFVSTLATGGFSTGDMGLGHIVVVVDDAAAAMTFYRDVLGFRVSDFITFNRRGTPVTMAFMHCNSRHHSFAFMEVLGAPRRLTHLMLELNDLDDVGRGLMRCERAEVPIAMTLGRHVNDRMLSFYATSPSGFNVEYGWGGRSVDDETWEVETYHGATIWGHAHPSKGASA